jgi:negative regulator of flagellin synthesis FlgM
MCSACEERITVKISGGKSIKPVAPTGVQDVAPAKTPAPAATSPARDKVEITSLSAQLQQIEQALSSVGVVDAARVEAIKLAISEGRFKIDSDVVADKLLATIREYLKTQQPS